MDSCIFLELLDCLDVKYLAFKLFVRPFRYLDTTSSTWKQTLNQLGFLLRLSVFFVFRLLKKNNKLRWQNLVHWDRENRSKDVRKLIMKHTYRKVGNKNKINMLPWNETQCKWIIQNKCDTYKEKDRLQNKNSSNSTQSGTTL